jgi:hypothetical protein
MIKYAVWSTHVGPRPEKDSKEPPVPAVNVLEVTRTDEKVAREDMSIIQDILHRKTWMVREES